MERRIPDLIQWHEGLLLTPQHFQQLSSRVESAMQALPSRYVPFYWGVRRFDYDAGAFTAGVLTVRGLDVVMPDGLHVHLAADRDELQLDLRPLAGTLRQSPLPVHLAMPIANGHSPVATQRFWSYESEPVADENTGDGGVTIPRLRPRLSLIAAVQPPARFTSFPLLEVRCEGETFLPTAFVPPTLHVATASTLGRLCGDVAQRIRTKAISLAEGAILTPQSPFALEARSQLHALAGAVPALEALLRTELAHPFTLYLELCRIAGHAAVLGNSLVPPVFSPYSHNDPRPAFEQVSQFITRSIDEGIPDTVRRFAFQQEEEAFRLVADPDWNDAFAWGSVSRVVLAVRSDAGEEQVVEWGENCVIGGQSAIASLLARRILGLTRRHADHVGELLPPRGMYFFELTADAEVLRAGEDLLVLGSSSGVRPEALYLYRVEPKGHPV
jgi:type VI secretion system protein ImpJ